MKNMRTRQQYLTKKTQNWIIMQNLLVIHDYKFASQGNIYINATKTKSLYVSALLCVVILPGFDL